MNAILGTRRRYDIDWMRVIAIGLLLIYHVAIGFQSWGIMIGFITNKEPWESLWIPMSMLNVWRIPLLFFVSGMGVYFAIRNRNIKELLLERAGRIFVPFVFGIFAIVPLHLFIWQDYYHMPLDYNANPGHLWFLGNIVAYVLIFAPLFFYFKSHSESRFAVLLKKVFSTPIGLILVTLAFVIEVSIVKPVPYEMYAMTWHGFFLGLISFFFGFCFVFSGQAFWNMLLKWRWLLLGLAAICFILRFFFLKMETPVTMLAAESSQWIFAVFAFGHKYLNRGGKALDYLSQAAYPVYILHMVFLYLGSWIIFPLAMPVELKFLLVLLFTIVGCLGFFEFVIRRVNAFRLLFGLKVNSDLLPVSRLDCK